MANNPSVGSVAALYVITANTFTYMRHIDHPNVGLRGETVLMRVGAVATLSRNGVRGYSNGQMTKAGKQQVATTPRPPPIKSLTSWKYARDSVAL